MNTMKVEPTAGITMTNSTPLFPPGTPSCQAAYYTAVAILILNLVIAAINFTYGIVNWIILPKWRVFKHYVYLNLIVTSSMNMIGFHYYAHYIFSVEVVVIILFLPRIIMCHWLIVTTFMLYMDIVKVFNIDFRRKYLYTNVFGWLVPCVEVLLMYGIDVYFKVSMVTLNFSISILLLIGNVIVYLIVTFNLIMLTLTQHETRRDLYSKLLLVTTVSIPSGLMSMMPVIVLEILHINLLAYIIILIMAMLVITAGHAVFFFMKSNRVLWNEYRRRRSVINALLDSISSSV